MKKLRTHYLHFIIFCYKVNNIHNTIVYFYDLRNVKYKKLIHYLTITIYNFRFIVVRVPLLNYGVARIQKLELPNNIYKRKTILNIKRTLDIQNKMFRLYFEKIIMIFSKIKSVLERLSIVFLFYKCSRSKVNVFSLHYSQQ